jgi:hypothetical protein
LRQNLLRWMPIYLLKTDLFKPPAAVSQPNPALLCLKPRQKAVFESFLMHFSGCSPINPGASSY